MNKFIEYDIHNGITLLKCAVKNVLEALDRGEIDSYKFHSYINVNLILNCAMESKWNVNYTNIATSPSGKKFIFNDREIKLYIEYNE